MVTRRRLRRTYRVIGLEQRGTMVDVSLMLFDEDAKLAQIKEKVAAEPISRDEDERQVHQFRQMLTGVAPEMMQYLEVVGKVFQFAQLQLTEEEYQALGRPGLGDEICLEATYERRRRP